jgi:hypothetical protein
VIIAPLILLPLLWWKVLSHSTTRFTVTVSAFTTFIYGYLLAAWPFRQALLGDDYSDRLFTTMLVMAGAAFVLFLIAAFRRSPNRFLLASSALLVSLTWYLVLVINSVV